LHKQMRAMQRLIDDMKERLDEGQEQIASEDAA
jgi:hypothetical protein